MNINMNVSVNDRGYGKFKQNNLNNRTVSQISFNGGKPLQNSSKTSKILKKMKLFFQRTFFKPSEYTVDAYCDDLYRMFYFYKNHDVNDKKLTKICSMLDVHSKNQEYSDFVKDGIRFLKNVKKLESGKKTKSRKFYTGVARDPEKTKGTVAAAGGYGAQFFSTVEYALKKAIRPNCDLYDYDHKGKVDDTKLQQYIKVAREYMAEFES